MALLNSTYGKGRVRVLRIHRDGDRHSVRELTVRTLLTGDFDRLFTNADNATAVSTDTVKNVINVVARENLDAQNEPFAAIVAERFLALYPQVASVAVTVHETRWTRMELGGVPHPHGFVLDGNGKPFAKANLARGGAMTTESGIDGFTFMKTTESGWAKYAMDPFTTIPETDDRIAATAMDASWRWSSTPADHAAANAKLLATMLEVFVTTYSASVQDSLYRMGMAALEAVPELRDISMACPNKHYLLINLARFGMENDNDVFLPTDEPHGQIECTVGRG